MKALYSAHKAELINHYADLSGGASVMEKCWHDALVQVVELCLGRPFHPDDSPRFRLVRSQDYSKLGVIFDGAHVCALEGNFVNEKGRTIYRVSSISEIPTDAQSVHPPND